MHILNKILIVFIITGFIITSVIALTSNSLTRTYTSPISIPNGLNISVTSPNQTWLDFDGVNDNATIYGNVLDSLSTKNYTVLVWINRTATLTSNVATDAECVFGSKAVVPYTTLCLRNSAYQLRYSNTTIDQTATTAQINQTWVQLGAIYHHEPSYSDLRLYLNGDFKSNKSFQHYQNLAGANLTIGTYPSTKYFNGTIDEIRIYDYAMDTRMVWGVYNSSDRFEKGKAIPSIYFHHINNTATTDDENLTTNVTMFTTYMTILNQSRVTPITYIDLVNYQRGAFVMPERPIIITFDDGYRDVYNNAYPIMQTYGYVGVFAVPPYNIENSQPRYASWANLQTMANSGWEIASHGMTQGNMSNFTQAQRATEFADSISSIEGNLSGVDVKTFIYPAHEHNSTIDNECASFGYLVCAGSAAFTNAPYFTYAKSSNLTHGNIPRIAIRSTFQLVDDIRNVTQLVKVNSPLYYYKINENIGTTLYDSASGNNATINEATWQTDGATKTLTKNVDYTYSNGVLTLLNTNYLYSQITATYYYTLDYINNSFNYMNLSIQFIIDILPIIGIIAGYIIFSLIFKQKIKPQIGLGTLIFLILVLWIMGMILQRIIGV